MEENPPSLIPRRRIYEFIEEERKDRPLMGWMISSNHHDTTQAVKYAPHQLHHRAHRLSFYINPKYLTMEKE